MSKVGKSQNIIIINCSLFRKHKTHRQKRPYMNN